MDASMRYIQNDALGLAMCQKRPGLQQPSNVFGIVVISRSSKVLFQLSWPGLLFEQLRNLALPRPPTVGAATKTGIEYAKNKADVIITFDADGQHNPKDIEKVAGPIIAKKADLVIGSRLLNFQKMPADRLFINWIANIATFILFGVFSTDSQSGLRAFSKKAAGLINFGGDRMDFSSEILLEAHKHRLKIKEVPTSAIYTEYSRTKGQKNINALPTLARLVVKLLR
jgi:glycosyltransferase involved in cell wall biosynthesis